MTFQVIAASVLLVGLGYFGVGWFYANGLHREVFAVGPRPPDLGVWVRQVGAGRIVLESPVPRQDIGHPGVFGLVWDGGHATVGEVIAAGDGRITRQFTPGPSGTPEVCVGVLSDCTPVRLDGYVYQRDPGDVGLDFVDIAFDSPLGSMGAWLVPGHREESWAIHCHGWNAERRELIRMLPGFHAAGRTSMVIDYRNDPGAPSDPSGRHRFGLSEWEDLEAAVAFAVDHGAEDVVLTGCSTGGALVMAFLERSELSSRVRGIVLDSPNIVLADTFRHRLREERGSTLIKEMALWIADLRWKVDWETTNFVQRAPRFLEVPALVFHGTSDLTVPITSSRQLEFAVPDLVELVETPAAGHVLSWNVDPARYERYVSLFLNRI